MEIIHHVSFNTLSSHSMLGAIKDLYLKYKILDLPGGGGQLVIFDISETNPIWNTVFILLKEHIGFDIYHSGDIYETYFSDEEIRSAEWLRLIPTFEQGYPQPKGNWPIKQQSLINVCPTCCTYQQNNPIRFYKEPALGQNSFMTLIGVGELFATNDVISNFMRMDAKGYETWNVIINKIGKVSEKVSQLYFPWITKPGLIDREEMRQVNCPNCGTIKYYPHKKGIMKFKREILIPGINFMRTYEWFGVGLFAFREILVSNSIAQLILDKGWKGVRFKVVDFK